MIDTDKYEGYTEGPWKIEGAKTIIGAEDLRITVKGGTQRDKNLRLIADAPLLLAEVKRLREVLKLFEQGFRLEDWLGIYHKDVLREWCDYLGIPEVIE